MSHELSVSEFEPDLQSPPQRVVSLVPSITESLVELDLGDRLVGITDYCAHPADALAHLPRLGGTKSPRIEDIIALKPDLVFMNREENRKEDALQLRQAGIQVWASHPRTVQEAINLLWAIMRVFDHPVMVERVRWIERQMDWTAAAAKSKPPVRVFVPIWYDPWMTISQHTYMHDLLRICGGINVFADLGDETRPYPEITTRQIEERQPVVVLLPDEPFKFQPSHADLLSQLDMPAAKTGHIHMVEGSLLTWSGTRMARAFSELVPLLQQAAPDSTEDR